MFKLMPALCLSYVKNCSLSFTNIAFYFEPKIAVYLLPNIAFDMSFYFVPNIVFNIAFYFGLNIAFDIPFYFILAKYCIWYSILFLDQMLHLIFHFIFGPNIGSILFIIVFPIFAGSYEMLICWILIQHLETMRRIY